MAPHSLDRIRTELRGWRAVRAAPAADVLLPLLGGRGNPNHFARLHRLRTALMQGSGV